MAAFAVVTFILKLYSGSEVYDQTASAIRSHMRQHTVPDHSLNMIVHSMQSFDTSGDQQAVLPDAAASRSQVQRQQAKGDGAAAVQLPGPDGDGLVGGSSAASGQQQLAASAQVTPHESEGDPDSAALAAAQEALAVGQAGLSEQQAAADSLQQADAGIGVASGKDGAGDMQSTDGRAGEQHIGVGTGSTGRDSGGEAGSADGLLAGQAGKRDAATGVAQADLQDDIEAGSAAEQLADPDPELEMGATELSAAHSEQLASQSTSEQRSSQVGAEQRIPADKQVRATGDSQGRASLPAGAGAPSPLPRCMGAPAPWGLLRTAQGSWKPAGPRSTPSPAAGSSDSGAASGDLATEGLTIDKLLAEGLATGGETEDALDAGVDQDDAPEPLDGGDAASGADAAADLGEPQDLEPGARRLRAGRQHSARQLRGLQQQVPRARPLQQHGLAKAGNGTAEVAGADRQLFAAGTSQRQPLRQQASGQRQPGDVRTGSSQAQAAYGAASEPQAQAAALPRAVSAASAGALGSLACQAGIGTVQARQACAEQLALQRCQQEAQRANLRTPGEAALADCLRAGERCDADPTLVREAARGLQGMRLLLGTRPRCLLFHASDQCGEFVQNNETSLYMGGCGEAGGAPVEGCNMDIREYPFPATDITEQYRTCAVVGNSMNVFTNYNGPAIDAHDAVFRFNFEEDSMLQAKNGNPALTRLSLADHLGTGTTVRLLSWERTLDLLKGGPGAEDAVAAEYTLFWHAASLPYVAHLQARYPYLSLAALSTSLVNWQLAVFSALRADAARLGLAPPRCYRSLSSGLHGLLLSLLLCERVDLFGFSTNMQQLAAGFHHNQPSQAHDWEFETLLLRLLYLADAVDVCNT